MDQVCKLCELSAHVEGSVDRPLVTCQRCGHYAMTKEALYAFEDMQPERRIPDRLRTLRGFVRWASDMEGTLRELTERDFDLSVPLPRPNALEIADRLLRWLAARSEGNMGQVVELRVPVDYPLVFGDREGTAVSSFVQYLKERGWIVESSAGGTTFKQKLSVLGWGRVDELERGAGDGSQAFVAMWFHHEMDEAYERGLRVGVERAGYEPVRVDAREHNDKIDDRIIAEIRRSRFVVADFTGQRPGVYYEAGFAQGLGLEVVRTVRKDDLDNVHFDTRQYNHIVWESADDLADRLRHRIVATLGRGPRP